MGHFVILGAQWGDEGKGKVADWFAQYVDIGVRFQGGHNAGHTIVVDSQTYKLSLIPTGILRGRVAVIGNGVVVDPWALYEEMEEIVRRGMTLSRENLVLADNVPLILPLHKLLDEAWERLRGKMAIGTTRRGIGPAYEDKVGRRAIRVCDLRDTTLLRSKVDFLLRYYNPFLESLNLQTLDKESTVDELMGIAPKILPYAQCVWRYLARVHREGKRILFEGAQGILLDIDHGTYPFVSSSNIGLGQVFTGSGLSFTDISGVLGVVKAYTTRVGGGPFPTECDDEDITNLLRDQGQEYGTVTGRPRRIGWFDTVTVRQAVKISGMRALILTKIDVLDRLEAVKICVGYEWRQQILDYLPFDEGIQAEIRPIYETLDVWERPTSDLRSWEEVPERAKRYVRRIQDLIGIPVVMMSTGFERNAMVTITDNPFII